jgi:hypothetical protein
VKEPPSSRKLNQMKYRTKINITPKELLDSHSIVYVDKGKELVLKCLFSNCDRLPSSRHLYINSDTGQFFCHKCQMKGNLNTLARYLGSNLSAGVRSIYGSL